MAQTIIHLNQQRNGSTKRRFWMFSIGQAKAQTWIQLKNTGCAQEIPHNLMSLECFCKMCHAYRVLSKSQSASAGVSTKCAFSLFNFSSKMSECFSMEPRRWHREKKLWKKKIYGEKKEIITFARSRKNHFRVRLAKFLPKPIYFQVSLASQLLIDPIIERTERAHTMQMFIEFYFEISLKYKEI